MDFSWESCCHITFQRLLIGLLTLPRIDSLGEIPNLCIGDFIIFFGINRSNKVDYERRLSGLLITEVKCSSLWCRKYSKNVMRLTAVCLFLLLCRFQIYYIYRLDVHIPILPLRVVVREAALGKNPPILMIPNIIFQHLQSKNINTLHQKAHISWTPLCTGTCKPTSDLMWFHVTALAATVSVFTDWTGCCFVADINLSVTTESICLPPLHPHPHPHLKTALPLACSKLAKALHLAWLTVVQSNSGWLRHAFNYWPAYPNQFEQAKSGGEAAWRTRSFRELRGTRRGEGKQRKIGFDLEPAGLHVVWQVGEVWRCTV